MLSSDRERTVIVDLIRLESGTPDGRLDENDEEVIESFGQILVRPQTTSLGSCIRVSGAARLGRGRPVVVTALVMPTRLGRRQAVMSQGPPGDRWWLGFNSSGQPMLRGGGRGRHLRGDRPGACGCRRLVLASGRIERFVGDRRGRDAAPRGPLLADRPIR